MKIKNNVINFLNDNYKRVEALRGKTENNLGKSGAIVLFVLLLLMGFIYFPFTKSIVITIITGLIFNFAFFGVYRFLINKEKNMLWDIFTLIFVVISAVLLFPAILIFIFYNVITKAINLKFFGKYPELFGLYFIIYGFAILIIYAASKGVEIGGDKQIVSYVFFIFTAIVLAIVHVLRKIIVSLAINGKNKNYRRYHINTELKLIINFFILILIAFNQIRRANDLFSTFLVFLSTLISILILSEKFNSNLRHKDYLKLVFEELEYCKEILKSIPGNTNLNIRFRINAPFLMNLNKSGRAKIKEAIRSIFDFAFHKESEKTTESLPDSSLSQIYHPFTYALSSQELISKIDQLLNAIAKAL